MARKANFVTEREFKTFQKQVLKGFKSLDKDIAKALKSLNKKPKKVKTKAA